MAFSNNNFDNSNSSLVVTALKSLTGLPIISQSEYWNQIHNGINNNAIYQNINPVSLHSSYLAGGEVQNNNDDSNPHYSLQGNENINQHDIDYSDSQFVSDTSFSTQESSHFCSANNTQCFIVNPNNFMMSSLQQQITQQIFPFQQHIVQKFQVFQLAQSHFPQQIQSQLSQIQVQFPQQIQSQQSQFLQQIQLQQSQFSQQIQSQHSQQLQISQQIQQNSNQISQKPTMIVIRICTLNGQIIPIKNVPIIAKISVIKFHIESKTRVPSNHRQRLIYSGILLKDNLTLLDYNILNNNVMINLIGQNNEVINFIDSDFLDPMYDCDFTNIVDDKKFMRGSYEYRRPCGWKRIAVKVLNKYGNNAWLGKAAKKGSWRYESDPNEWPVSYHGTDKFNARSIAETGFDITKGKRFKFGYGIYSTPDINVAALFANKFIHNNEVYCLVFQNRVNPQTLNKINTSIGEYWISPKSDDIRPYGICIKKLGKIYP
ncbi:unnamed protein product [Rhizophagus irregularis]|uniref:Ubiquitin-like domain-containing protein n=2 Tax=Rhizophagus irregularis TaxID=588596 RepID=A0A915Z8V0_9GLOM|nr:unnamed protein product [Rhizophagus irregularis]CAB5366420.1 unnamed protein product [Rhizophagus irregularis]